MSAKFQLDQRVKKIGSDTVQTVQRVIQSDGNVMYEIQLGNNVRTREWVREDELEPAGKD
jgi:hypothetical protein